MKKLRKRNNKLLVIAGPTASGKSDLAVFLAKKFSGEVISADSRQVYKYMDIGTGKVTEEEMQGVPHHMLSIRHPSRQLTVAEYKKKAQKVIADIQKRGKLPILVGGTGFYIDAVVYDIDFPEVAPNKELREKLEKKNTEKLYAELKKKDPRRAQSVQRANKRRIIRALEIIEALGKVPELRIKNKESRDILILGIKISKEVLHKRIKKRLDARFKEGMVQEVKELHDKHRVSWERIENFGLEYRRIAQYLQDKISKEEMYENLLGDIKQYARRQMTWFKRDKNIRWIDFKNKKQLQKEAVELAEKFIL